MAKSARHTPKQIISKLREAELKLAKCAGRWENGSLGMASR